MEKPFDGQNRAGWPAKVPTGALLKYIYIRINQDISKSTKERCWYKGLEGKVFKVLNKLHFGFLGHQASFVTRVDQKGNLVDSILLTDCEVLGRGEPIVDKLKARELTMEELVKEIGPFKLVVT